MRYVSLMKKNNGTVPVPQEKPPFIFEDFVHTIQGREKDC